MSDALQNPETHIALFQRQAVRRTIHNNEWWFVIADVVGVLTDAVDPGDYLKKMRKRDPALANTFKGGVNLSPPLVLSSTPSADAKCSSAGTPKVSSV